MGSIYTYFSESNNESPSPNVDNKLPSPNNYDRILFDFMNKNAEKTTYGWDYFSGLRQKPQYWASGDGSLLLCE